MLINYKRGKEYNLLWILHKFCHRIFLWHFDFTKMKRIKQNKHQDKHQAHKKFSAENFKLRYKMVIIIVWSITWDACAVVKVTLAIKRIMSITRKATTPECWTTTYWIQVSSARNVGNAVQIPVILDKAVNHSKMEWIPHHKGYVYNEGPLICVAMSSLKILTILDTPHQKFVTLNLSHR